MEKLRIRSHGRYSLEIKSRYILLKPPQKRGRCLYDIDIYFFFPHSFNINPVTYQKERFNEDLKLYLRFDTPSFTIQELLDEKSSLSPLVRAENMVHNHKEKEPFPEEPFIYETKLLGNVYKSLFRDWFSRLRRQRIPEYRPLRKVDEEAASFKENSEEELIKEISYMYKVPLRFHELLRKSTAEHNQFPLRHCKMIDEHLSLLSEKYLLYCLELFKEHQFQGFETKAEEIILTEMEYRRTMSYSTVAKEKISQKEAEDYTFREKLLKRYSSEILFNEMKKTDTGKWVEHILYGVAAGIAMVVATSIAFLGQTSFGNLSLSLFMLLVVGYILKDRLKDLVRNVFLKTIGSRFFDRSISLYDPRYAKKMGSARDREYFVPEKKLSRKILSLRTNTKFQSFIHQLEEETTFKYQKRIRLNARTLSSLHHRIHGFADITIINIEPFLRSLSNQYGRIPVRKGRSLMDIKKVKRTYYLTVIVRLKDNEGAELFKQCRLVVDGGGIRRIERVHQENYS